MSLRELFVEYSNLTRADGSAILCQGNTVCQSAVYGPKFISSSREHVQRSLIDVLFKRKANNSYNVDNKVMAHWIKAALEQVIITDDHPHTTVSLTIQEIENDGSILAAALNSVCCALMDSGIPMKCLIAAVSATIDEEGNITVDSRLKEGEYSAILTFAFESIKCGVVSVTTDGSFTQKEFTNCLKLCKSAAKEVFDFYENSIKQRFENS